MAIKKWEGGSGKQQLKVKRGDNKLEDNISSGSE